MWGEKMEPRILDAIQRLNNPALDWFMCFITGFGNFGVSWLLVAVVLMVIPRTRRIGVTVFIGLPLCGCCAASYQRRLRRFVYAYGVKGGSVLPMKLIKS